jgi:hypothetical protein
MRSKADALKRLRNISTFWTDKMAAATSDEDLVRICYDRARAAARRAQKDGDQAAVHNLAEMLAHWAHDREWSEIARHSA